MNSRFAIAIEFCKKSHGEQKRKYTGDPYWTHPVAVAMMVQKFTIDDDVIKAAILHDVLEDTTVIYDEIVRAFNSRVADLVQEVTDASKPSDGNRKKRKAIDLEHLAKSSPEGATIKLADILDNTASIIEHDRNFAKIYLPEKILSIDVLKHGNSNLWHITHYACIKALTDLEVNYDQQNT